MVDHVKIPFVYTKRGVFYFTRRIPKDLLGHYETERVVFSLKTKSNRIARQRAASLAVKLDEDWITLRWRSLSDPFQKFLKNKECLSIAQSVAPLFSEAKELYLKAKDIDRPKTFKQSIDRAVNYLFNLHGDKPIDTYTRIEANELRDAFIEKGLSRNSIKRLFSSLIAIVNFSSKELGIDEVRTFSAIVLGDMGEANKKKRPVFPMGVLSDVQRECRVLDDEPRWLIALLSDTGMRLSEAVGLIKEDIILDTSHPYITLGEHTWRRLKTRSSTRKVPLTGNALWAIQRAIDASSNKFVFPKYCNDKEAKGNAASGALNKWMSPRVPDGCVVHSFRHTMRDRLRAVECPSDIIDRIGGWTVEGVGETYGDGYPVNVLHKWVKKVTET